jgi:YegS/Rv2252/BmrU family lipid kinase
MKPEDGYIGCIINPKAGAGSQQGTARRFTSYLTAEGYNVRTMLTGCLHDAYDFAQNFAQVRDCLMVVAVGGDGLVREVTSGLRGSDKPLLIIPAGTENLLANELGFDEKFSTIAGAFEEGYIKSLDLGIANGQSFTSIAGIGFDGKIVERVYNLRQGHIDHLDYLGPAWRTFWDYRYDTIKVEVDGKTVFDGRGIVFVGNISRYALGLQLLHYADFSDGLLDICIYKCSSRGRLLKQFIMTIMKQHFKFGDVIYKQGKKILVSSQAADVPVEIDGDPGPNLPVEIEVIPQAIKVVVPRGGRPAGIRTRLIRALG